MQGDDAKVVICGPKGSNSSVARYVQLRCLERDVKAKGEVAGGVNSKLGGADSSLVIG